MASKSVLVTGANGFVGTVLCRALAAAGHSPRAAVRRTAAGSNFPGNAVHIGDIDDSTDWSEALRGIAYVVHLASPSESPSAASGDLLAGYRKVNVAGSRRLAQYAARAGVRRLVYLSTIKVNGEGAAEHVYTEDDVPRPEYAYGISKQEAEQALRDEERATGLEVIVLRPPLVYGPEVRGNFLRLMHLVARGMPLPLGAVTNHRSLIYAGNLAHAIVTALNAPSAAGRTYLVSDGEDLSTPELVRMLAQALGVKPRLLPVPLAALRVAAALAGKRAELAPLTHSLQVDSSRIRSELAWRPPFTLAQGLELTARWYHSRSA